MFGLDSTKLIILIVVGLCAEAVLLWVAASLADAPEQNTPKLFGLGMAVFAICFAAAAGIAYGLGVLEQPLNPDRRSLAIAAGGLALVASLLLPALAYPALLSVSPVRGLWVSTLQLLLRIFLYVLITAIIMVALAVVQIYRTPRTNAQLPPAPFAARA